MKRILIMSSKNGSNAINIISYFEKSSKAIVVGVLSNNPKAKVLERVKNIPTLCFNNKLFSSNLMIDILNDFKPDMIVLAGFLWKIPPSIIKAFDRKIINIHPSLLPKYGGKGMYGLHVHQAVKENKDKITGITIHYINENYDEGSIIKQFKTPISTEDTPEDIAQKVHELEYKHFPKVIASLIGVE